MALTKTPVPITFGKGLDTKTDPNQIQMGNFLALENSVFDTLQRLTKRNGFANITNLPNANQTTLTTLNDNLVATGSNLFAFSQDTNQWLNKGTVQPLDLSVLPLVRVSTSQTSPDIAIAPDALVILSYVDSGNVYYQVSDSVTGQQVIPRVALPAGAVLPRVFNVGDYFLLTYIDSNTNELLSVIIPINNIVNGTALTITIGAVTGPTAGYSGTVLNNTLYIAWSSSAGVDVSYITNQGLTPAPPVTIAGHQPALISVTTDPSQIDPYVFVSFADLRHASTSVFTQQYSATTAVVGGTPTALVPISTLKTLATGVSLSAMTSNTLNGELVVILDNFNNYGYTVVTPGYPGTVQSDFLSTLTYDYTTTLATVSQQILRSVGLASKSFVQYVYTLDTDPYDIITSDVLPGSTTSYTLISSTIYFLATYGEPSQPTYFLVDSAGNIIMKLAYSNGGGYYPNQLLPNAQYFGGSWYVPYLFKDFLTTVNKGSSVNSTGTPVVSTAIYAQTGVNMAKIGINLFGQYSSEIAGALHLTGGQLWEYDAVKPVEHSFAVWPESIGLTTSGTGGLITAGTYFYQFTYEWTDNQGNLHRSAPSIPVSIVTTGSISSNTIRVPTYRLTYKQPYFPPTNPAVTNPVRIVGYRWSAAQEIFYQFTSVTAPVLNDTTIDSVTIVDTLADSAILGNAIIYTTGGVVENIAAPASVHSALFKNRMFLIDAEDRNLLWYSKQVIEATPVEFSDLFTLYIAPTTGTQGSTGPSTALSAMDDKLIIFKKNAAYYLTGTGPDNTGANNDFNDPIFITASVGCDNPASIVLMQNGIMFQSKEKGIWLLGRDLSTNYIGAPVEKYNGQVVVSAESIPGTNQVRFVLDNSITLMYDYFVGQWGVHTNKIAESATLYHSKHTYLNSVGQVYQETSGTYTDGSSPVLISFTTAWMSLAGLRGFERFYFMFLLGTYFSPFKLNVQLSYDYSVNPEQSIIVTPDNHAPNYGDETLWGGGGPWGGSTGTVFQARIFPAKQKCQTFQVTVTEVYDASLGVPPGQGLSLSGMNIVIGAKKGYNTQKASRSFG